MCDGSGRRETLQCPYHAWTYGLDGRLITAPRGNKEGGIAKEELGLVPLHLETWGPLLFVNPDSAAESLAAHLDGIPERSSISPTIPTIGDGLTATPLLSL